MERELKFGLSQADYKILLAASPKQKAKRQLNTYFDTPRLELKRLGAGLRVRIEDGKQAYLTLKCATPQTAASAKRGRHVRREWECALALGKARRLITQQAKVSALKTPVHRHLEALLPGLADQLIVVGTVRTSRTPIRIGRFLAELDAWSVGTRRFYELELETAALDRAEKALRARFLALGIRARPRSATKLAAVFRLGSAKSRR